MPRITMFAGVLLFALLSGCASSAPSPGGPGVSGAPLTQAQAAEYRAALAEMMADDQRHRHALTWETTDPDELDRLSGLSLEESLAEQSRRREAGIRLDPGTRERLERAQTELDIANTRRLMELVRRYGWPTERTLGAGFEDPTAILIHMRPEDTDKALPTLKAETLAGRMPPKKYAMIFDRQRQHHGRPQLYGTVQAFDPETRTVRPPAIVDPDATNRARAEIGLGPLTEFRVTDARTAAGS